MVKLVSGLNKDVPLGKGIAVLNISPVIVFEEKYTGDIILKKYGDSTEEKKVLSTSR